MEGTNKLNPLLTEMEKIEAELMSYMIPKEGLKSDR